MEGEEVEEEVEVEVLTEEVVELADESDFEKDGVWMVAEGAG